MKTAILLHGTGGSDKNNAWFDDTKEYLESNGYEVWWPLLPHTEKPELVETRDFIEENLPEINEETIIIGHSSACSLTLNLLERGKTKVKQIILVAGFYQSLDDDGYSDLMLPKAFDWENIKNKAGEFVLINSDDDPWDCDDMRARPIALELGATLIVAIGQGHMGSMKFNQPYKEFSLLKRLLKV